ncbi:ATPase, T2SS/T4P/T4SS family [Bacillus cihuensis]|uniref:ATPase, T2SS/T4P/T4SS family n=1 Tax=Bacillus cihuensis TaxID=1208599 RepID=UPI000426D40F|nr:ATPase, T2SS/T4P/T4SS family [Bacillus cihuensis]
MTQEVNIVLSLLLIGSVIFFIVIRLLSQKKVTKSDEVLEQETFQLDKVHSFVKKKINEMTSVNLYNLGLAEEAFIRQTRRLNELKESLKMCNTGDINSKTYVKEFLYDLLKEQYGFNEQNVNITIPFDQPQNMSVREMFDTLLFIYQKSYKFNALSMFMTENHLDEEKEDGGFRVTADEIRQIYKKKVKNLTFEDKLRIITQRIYAQYKGFGVIDEIRDMKIDGVSGGVSGLPKRLENFDDEELLVDRLKLQKQSFDSVWFMFKGKTIHLSFLSFEHEAELRRVVQNVYKYNHPGQLSESRPYLINEMFDGSRVVVVRPKFAESWAFFIRKFDTATIEIEKLLIHENKNLPIRLMSFLMAGNRITAITGSQGSGKTTLLMALIQYIHKSLTLRIQETSFELNLRRLYPDRNILSFQETDIVSGQEGLDLQKKTDGAVNIVGEVATDEVAALMIQSSQVASLFTLFSHHSKTLSDLIYSIRNSLLKTGMFSNESIAEQQVVSVLEFDIHIERDYDGTRYIQRITECIPVNTDESELALPALNELSKEEMFYEAATTYFRQATKRRQFRERNIVEFIDGRYEAVNPISKERQEDMLRNLPIALQSDFRSFINEYWGASE